MCEHARERAALIKTILADTGIAVDVCQTAMATKAVIDLWPCSRAPTNSPLHCRPKGWPTSPAGLVGREKGSGSMGKTVGKREALVCS